MTNKQLRKIDALVAEHIFNIEVVDFDEIVKYCPSYRIGTSLKYINIPHYSTDIAAAEKITQKFEEVTLNYSKLYNSIDLDVECTITSNGRWTPFGRCGREWKVDKFTAKAETAPLAICLAALKTKGVKYE